MRCTDCPLHHAPTVSGYGEIGGLMLIGEAPGNDEVRFGRPFVGRSGTILRQALAQANIDASQIYITNTVLCHPDGNGTPTPAMIQACHSRLIAEIHRVHPKRILTLGTIPFQALFPNEPSGITRIRGRYYVLVVDGRPIPVLPTLHPAFVLRNPDWAVDFLRDLEKFSLQTGPMIQPRLGLSLPTSIEELSEILQWLSQAPKISIDIESTGFSPINDELIFIGIGALVESDDLHGDLFGLLVARPLLLLQECREALLHFFENFKGHAVFHNYKFDLKFLIRYFETRIRFMQPEDTMILHYLLDERSGGRGAGHGLKELAKQYDLPHEKFNFDDFLRDLGWDGVTRNLSVLVPNDSQRWRDFMEYLAKDLWTTLVLFEDQIPLIEAESDRLMSVYSDLLIPAADMFADIESHGALVDMNHLREALVTAEATTRELGGKIQVVASRFGLHEAGRPFPISAWTVSELMTHPDCTDPAKLWEDYRYYREYKTAWRLAVLGGDLSPETESLRRRWQIRSRRILSQAEVLGTYIPAAPFNPASTFQVKTLLDKLGIAVSSTSKDELLVEQTIYERGDERKLLIGWILDYRLWEKVKSTYLLGLLNSADKLGRVHPDFSVIGTSTGRLSCRNPNLMNIPTLMGPLIRSAFIPGPIPPGVSKMCGIPEGEGQDDTIGWTFVKADLSQIELRVAAYYSMDERMITAYKEGRDIHREVAAAMFNKPPDQISHHERYLAKYVDFGVIYGRGAQSLVDGWEMAYYERELGGKGWTLEEAERFRDEFLSGFPGLKEWIEQQHAEVLRRGYTETPLGRRRRFSLTDNTIGSVQRQAVNTPIQSFASDIVLMAALRLHEKLDRTRARILFLVHDEIDFEVRDDYLEEAVKTILFEMEQAPFITDVIPIRAETDLGPSWGGMEK